MKITTVEIMNKLIDERELNMYVSPQLLEKTDKWIDTFKAYPEIEFELTGDYDSIVKLLEMNTNAIDESIFKHKKEMSMLFAATEEESGSVEGFMIIEEETPQVILEKPADNEGEPTLTIKYTELCNMFSHMEKIVEAHTKEIEFLKAQLQEKKDAKRLEWHNLSQISDPGPTISVAPSKEQGVTIQKTAFEEPPALPSVPYPTLYGEPGHESQDEAILDLSDEYDHDQFAEPDHIDEHDLDNFGVALETQSKQNKPAKPNLDRKKKMLIAGTVILALVMFLVILLLPSKKTVAPEPKPQAPAAAAKAQAMNNVTTANSPAQASKAAVASPATTSVADQQPPSKENSPSPNHQPVIDKASVVVEKEHAGGVKYAENMNVYVKAGNDNIIYLNKGEKVLEIQGTDTESWTFNYDKAKSQIVFNAKTNKLKNTVIIHTDKKLYTINFISSNKGHKQIDLR